MELASRLYRLSPFDLQLSNHAFRDTRLGENLKSTDSDNSFRRIEDQKFVQHSLQFLMSAAVAGKRGTRADVGLPFVECSHPPSPNLPVLHGQLKDFRVQGR